MYKFILHVYVALCPHPYRNIMICMTSHVPVKIQSLSCCVNVKSQAADEGRFTVVVADAAFAAETPRTASRVVRPRSRIYRCGVVGTH